MTRQRRITRRRLIAAAGALPLAMTAMTNTDASSAAEDLAVRNPRCEYLTEPLGIDAARPRLSWTLESGRRGVKQAAYRVLVASTPERLRAGEGDLWDSGRVASDDTAQVRYGGTAPLASGQACHWKVRVWDDTGATAECAPARWEMGLLAPGDWHGTWIARTTDTAVEAVPLLRRGFALDGKIKSARLYASGLGFHELRVNGRKVGDSRLDPAWTRYDRRVLYVAHDVTKLLKRGDNALGVMLGNGWYNVQAKAAWDFDRAPWRATPRLLLELRVTMEDGSVVTVASDERWKTADSPITFSGIYGGEDYDARREQSGWDAPGFDDSGWQAALVVDAPKGKLAAQAMHPVRTDRVIKPVKVTEPEPGVFVFDAGENVTGNARLRLSGPAGTRVTMRYGERLHPSGRLDQKDIAVHVLRYGADQPFQTDHYILKGQGTEEWESRFNYNGFRYVEVTVVEPGSTRAPGKLTAANLTVNYFHSDVPEAGAFACSNPLLNRIWENGRRSYLGNLFGLPTDCPHREKNGWTGDAHVACEQGLFYNDGITVYEKWIRDVGDEQRPTGAIPGIVPTNGEWGYAFGAGPAWDSAFLIVPWHLYEYYGDDTALRAHYEGYKRYVDYLTTRATHGSPKESPTTTHLVKFGLGDWSFWKTETPVEVTDTGYYYHDARLVARVARMLGKDDDAKKYDALADTIRAAFNKAFFDPGTGSYGNGSQTSLGCALYQGLAEPENEPRVVDNLVAAIEKTDRHLDFGLLGSKYVLNALSDHGRADVAYAMAAQKTQPSWGWWAEQGMTTLLERWTLDDSHNHTFLGDVNAWMVKTLAGIRPDPSAPGFRNVRIEPNVVGDLTAARASYDSVRGRIVSDWKVEKDGTFRLTVTVPANATASVTLPVADPSTVREGGKSAVAAEGVRDVRPSEVRGKTLLSVGSGTYRFSGPLAR